MPEYIVVGSYSTGSWARLMRRMDDRIAAARSVAEALGGSLERVYWELSARSVSSLYHVPGEEADATI